MESEFAADLALFLESVGRWGEDPSVRGLVTLLAAFVSFSCWTFAKVRSRMARKRQEGIDMMALATEPLPSRGMSFKGMEAAVAVPPPPRDVDVRVNAPAGASVTVSVGKAAEPVPLLVPPAVSVGQQGWTASHPEQARTYQELENMLKRGFAGNGINPRSNSA